MMLTLLSPDFEVFFEKGKVFHSSGQNGWLITVFGLFPISLIIFICTVLRHTNEN